MKKIIKTSAALLAALLMLTGCSGGFTSEEPCAYCHDTPTKEFKTTNGTACYICEGHTKTCAVCNHSFDKELSHATNLFDIEIFVCDECREAYY